MSVQLRRITLYSFNGEIRNLDFRLGAVNVITGKSRTGKSAIIDIIDYCLGRSTFGIFEGVNRDAVSWYSVTLRVDDGEVFLAKPAPTGTAVSQSRGHLRTGHRVDPPKIDELVLNTDDESIVSYLSSLIGIGANRTEIVGRLSRDTFQASLKHAKFFLFLEQGVIANKFLLFHRQAETMVDQHIRDTLPFFLGGVDADRLRLIQERREARREANVLRRSLEEAESISAGQSNRAISLLEEAKAVGLLPELGDVSDPIAELKRASDSLPEPRVSEPKAIDPHLAEMRSQLTELRRTFRDLTEGLRQAEAFEKNAEDFRSEAGEQTSRLESLNIFSETEPSEPRCPVCESSIREITPTIKQLQESLTRLNSTLAAVDKERVPVRAHVLKLQAEIDVTRTAIINLESAIAGLESESESSRDLSARDTAAAHTRGRISLFLESAALTQTDSTLQMALERAENRVALLEEKLSDEDSEDLLTSNLNRLSVQMTEYANALDLEHRDTPYRLDIKGLTVVADTPARPIPMARMGSAENWLGCHIISHFALHSHFLKNNRPVPNFLIMDQPSQVYFPSPQAYLALDGTVAATETADADLIAVQRLFDFFFDVCEKLAPDFQVIVTEHANLPSTRFQEALVEQPWNEHSALIPKSWIKQTPRLT